MCGRYALKTDIKQLAKRFGAKPPAETFEARYNISPTQEVPVIRNTDPGQLALARWGIVPDWDKTGKKTIINARDDSLGKPTFRKSFRERRCLVLADSFYEWLATSGQRSKRPFRFFLKSEEPFAFAGIWSERAGEEGGKPYCAIITTGPNGVVGKVHDRMPAILLPEAEADWLSLDTTPEQALELVRPYPDELMGAYEVSTLINSPANDAPEILRPINSQ